MKNILLAVVLVLLAISSEAQNGVLRGKVMDAVTKETMIGAYVMYGDGQVASTDFNGGYEITLPYGIQTVSFSYVGYKEVVKQIDINKATTVLDIKLDTEIMSEAEVVADVARERETPVAFTNILPAQIQEELASQDMPMIMNSTPGVYATQQGGGDGDARVTIRGFSQSNVAVMIDGIPVNDMENGWVYWSNWFGLDAVTQSMQVQRGLGASKIVIPSVGGTINIITKGIDAKKGVNIKQEVASFGFLRTSVGLTTGRMDNGWGITAAGSFKQGDGWVTQNFTEGWFYYLKVEKQLGKHLMSLSGMGAPQSHGQRSFSQHPATYSSEFARDLGVSDSLIALYPEYGLNYNEHWGSYQAHQYSSSSEFVEGETILVNERVNYFHKPQFALRDFWPIRENLYISNIAYLSIGNGGGTGLNSTSGVGLTPQGNFDFQEIYNGNMLFEFGPNGLNIDEDGEVKSSKYLRASVNNHFWYGYLGSVTWAKDEHWTVSGGLDFRKYKGEHYREVYDLLGGDYALDDGNLNQRPDVKLRKGDKYAYSDEGHVLWGGSFVQTEFKNELWSTFVNVSFAQSRYKAIDYFRKKIVEVGDTSLEVGFLPVEYNGTTYDQNSPGIHHYETEWVVLNGFTIKGGANYNINERLNGFVNLGYLSKAPLFSNVIDISNNVQDDYKNEVINGYEAGLSYAESRFAANLNGYHTTWNNRPVNRTVQQSNPLGEEDEVVVRVTDMDARHMGVEFDFAYKATSKVTVEGLFSFGDWIWTSTEEGELVYSDSNEAVVNPETGEPYIISFDPSGVHVGNAAQTQFGASLRYEPIKQAYLKLRLTYFSRQFAEFSPESLVGNNAGTEVWQTPGYTLIDVHAGYWLKFKGQNLNIRATVFNLLDAVYVSDAQNNDTFIAHTESANVAGSSSIFVGPSRRFNLSLSITI
jgi:iron complex outermembrane recepter protein